MKNESFGRKVKNAYKNARREYENHRVQLVEKLNNNEISPYKFYGFLWDKEVEVCTKNFSPLGLHCQYFGAATNLIKRMRGRKWKTLSRLCRSAKRKDKQVNAFEVCRFVINEKTDWRELPFTT